MAATPRVGIVYHFFAHYRAGINQALLDSARYDYLFVGDEVDPQASGIKAWTRPATATFVSTHCRLLARKFLVQSGVIRFALRRDVQAIIFLGDAQYLTTWAAALLARLTGKRVFFWTHGWSDNERGFKDRVRRAFYRLAHGLLLYGHRAKHIGAAKGFAPAQMHVIYNSLDYAVQRTAREAVVPDELAQLRAELFPRAPQHPLLLCSSRLLPQRRLDVLLEAMQRLRDDGIETHLLLIGDGPARAALAEQAERLHLSVHFYGACYDEDTLARLMMAADATVVPAQLGLTAMHSLAYGTPVFTHHDAEDHGPEFEAVIPGYNGNIFQRNDSADLARVLRAWFARAEPASEVRRRCYEVVERFYNPDYQRQCIERALDGLPPDDEAWEAFQRDHAPTAVLV